MLNPARHARRPNAPRAKAPAAAGDSVHATRDGPAHHARWVGNPRNHAKAPPRRYVLEELWQTPLLRGAFFAAGGVSKDKSPGSCVPYRGPCDTNLLQGGVSFALGPYRADTAGKTSRIIRAPRRSGRLVPVRAMVTAFLVCQYVVVREDERQAHDEVG